MTQKSKGRKVKTPRSDQITKLIKSQDVLKIKNKNLKMINAKMIELTRLKDEFVANMSHELRTPLTGIIGFAELMHDGKVGNVSEEHKDYLAEILSNANLLLTLINDTLDLAKIESGKMDFYPKRIDLHSIINEVESVFDKSIKEKDISLVIDVDPNLDIITDPNKLKQVIFNFVSNALKFSNKGGQVTISAYFDTKKTFRLEVSDKGIGLARKDFKKLFVKFQQLDSSYTKKYQGTGLGLALTRRIVEAQGGRVGAESVFGKGSTFYAILPCHAFIGKAKELKRPHTKRVTIKHSKKTPTILVIEDLTQERNDLISALITKGYNVKIANNVNEAISEDQIYTADAIVLDFFSSNVNKWKLLRACRCKKPFTQAPDVLITGVVKDFEAFGYKIHDFLVKPVTPKELIDALVWSGASPHTNKYVLIIDEKTALKPHSIVLKEYGYNAIYESDIEKALLIVETNHPDVLILNPFIESNTLNGFDFLHRLRLTFIGRYTPIVITTLKLLDEKDREHVKGVIQRVVLKKDGSAKSLLDEITQQYPIP